MQVFSTKFSALAAGLATVLLVGFSTSTTSVAAAPKAPAPAAMRAAAENDALDFDLVNKTGYKLKNVYISPSASDSWDDDILGGQRFEDGETLHITFSAHAHAEHWDMKVVYAIDGSSHTFTRLNLTSISKVTLWYDADANSTHADVE